MTKPEAVDVEALCESLSMCCTLAEVAMVRQLARELEQARVALEKIRPRCNWPKNLSQMTEILVLEHELSSGWVRKAEDRAKKAEAEVKRLREALEFWHESRAQCDKCRSRYKSVEELISAALEKGSGVGTPVTGEQGLATDPAPDPLTDGGK